MSCDSRRGAFFARISREVVGLVTGDPAAAGQFLHTLYDVASSQPVPEDRAAQLAAAAAFQKLKARAAKDGVDLYPHKSKTGLPDLASQQGWRAVSEAIDAIEQGGPLPPAAQDVLGSIMFARLLADPQEIWSPPMRGATRVALRQAWLLQPALIERLLRDPGALGEAAPEGWLRAQTELLSADPEAPPGLAAAARHALALDDAEMLEADDRSRWAQTLASAAGVGVGRRRDGKAQVCPDCGACYQKKHTCQAIDRTILPQVVAAVAAGLADPTNVDVDADTSPRITLARLLATAEARGLPDDPDESLATLLAVARLMDRADLQHFAALPDARRRLREMTIRTPLQIDGERYVWDDGCLYPEELYRTVAQWERHGTSDESLVTPDQMKQRQYLAITEPSHLADMLTGRRYAPGMVGWKNDLLIKKFGTERVSDLDLRPHDVLVEPCGCLFRQQKDQAGITLVRIALPSNGRVCFTHVDKEMPAPRRSGALVTRLDANRPRFGQPVWPNDARLPEGGG